MDRLKLDASYRTDMSKGHMKSIRRRGYVTGSIFGHGEAPISVEVKLEDLVDQIRKSEAGTKSLIDVNVKGAPVKSDGIVIINEFTKDPLTRKVLNIQFQRVSMKEKVHVGVPIVPTGEPVGAKLAGILEQLLDELSISCLPGDIPPRVEVDVSGLGIGEHIRVEDISLEGDIEILASPDMLIFTCAAPHVHAKDEEVVAEAPEAEAEPAEAETSS